MRAAGRAVAAAVTERTLIEAICDVVVQLAGHPLAWVELVPQDGAEALPLICRAADGRTLVPVSGGSACEPPSATCLRTGQAAILNDLADPRVAPWREEAARRGCGAVACVPLQAGGDTLGVLAALAHRSGAFDAGEVELLVDLASALASGLRALRADERGRRLVASLGAQLAQLRAREEESRTILQTSIDGFAVMDAVGRFLDVNDAVCRMTGYAREELLAMQIGDLPASTAGRAARLGELVATQPNRTRIRLQRRDGSEIDIEASACFLALNGARLAAFLRDVTEETRAAAALRETQEQSQLYQRQLLQAQKLEAVGRLAGGVAHDFNNLLCAINGYADTLVAELPEGDPRRDDAAEIGRAGQRAAALTRQLLLFSRSEKPLLQTVDLARAMEELSQLLRRLIGEDVALLTDLSPATVLADRSQLEQLVVNLVVNARDAMSEGGTLTIATGTLAGPEGHQALLRVRDTGCGMSEEVRAHLFEPFFTTKERGKGTGLGLATVYGIVQTLGGRIEVESAVGMGTTFTVLLPLAPGEPQADAGPSRPTVRPGNGTVLVVEDDEAVRRLILKVLRDHGYRALEAADGAAALGLCDSYPAPIDAIVTDVVMPRMTGGELARAAGQLRPAAKVMYMSGHPEDVSARHGIAAERAPLLAKPFTPEQLLRAVDELLGPSEAEPS